MRGPRVFVCTLDGPLIVDADCPNSGSHQPHPRGYIAQSAWAEAALHVADQQHCAGCGKWAIWVPKRADLRISKAWPNSDCSCGNEGVGERLIDGEWVSVCPGHVTTATVDR